MLGDAPSYPWHSTESDKRPLIEGSTKSNVKEPVASLTMPPAPPAPRPPQKVEPHPNIVQSENRHIVDDVNNKLSSAYSFLQMAYEDKIPFELRESQRLQALENFRYLIERLKEIK